MRPSALESAPPARHFGDPRHGVLGHGTRVSRGAEHSELQRAARDNDGARRTGKHTFRWKKPCVFMMALGCVVLRANATKAEERAALSGCVAADTAHVPITFGVDTSWLRQQLAEHVPSTWNEENRAIAPGMVADVALTRGEITAALEADLATFSMPVDMHLSVRSRLGAWAVPVGRCHSSIDVTVTASLRLSSEGALPLPSGRAQLRQPCRLSALDVTPFLQHEIDRQLARLQRRLGEWQQRQQAEFQALRDAAFRRLEGRSRSALRFCPTGVRQIQPSFQGEVALAGFSVDGCLAQQCEHGVTGVAYLTEPPTPRFAMLTTERIMWSALGAAVARHLAAAGKPVTVSAHLAGSTDAPAIGLLVRGTRLQGRILAQARIERGLCRLVDFSSDDPELLAEWRSELETLALPVDASTLEKLAAEVLDESNSISRFWGERSASFLAQRIESTELETAGSVSIEPDGLAVALQRRARPALPVPPATTP